MTLGEKLQLLRKSRGLSQEQLAETLAVSRQAVSKWENDDSAPDLDRLRAICTYFDVTADYLLWEHAEEPGHGAHGTAKKTEPAAHAAASRIMGREYLPWCGYAAAILGAALFARTLAGMIPMLLMLSPGGSAIWTFKTLARFYLPHLLVYGAMIAGGILLGRWLRKWQGMRKNDDV